MSTFKEAGTGLFSLFDAANSLDVNQNRSVVRAQVVTKLKDYTGPIHEFITPETSLEDETYPVRHDRRCKVRILDPNMAHEKLLSFWGNESTATDTEADRLAETLLPTMVIPQESYETDLQPKDIVFVRLRPGDNNMTYNLQYCDFESIEILWPSAPSCNDVCFISTRHVHEDGEEAEHPEWWDWCEEVDEYIKNYEPPVDATKNKCPTLYDGQKVCSGYIQAFHPVKKKQLTRSSTKLIVIHATGGQYYSGRDKDSVGFNADSRLRINNGTAAHYTVGQEGRVWQSLKDSQRAYHATCVNDRSLGIEHTGKTHAQKTYVAKPGCDYKGNDCSWNKEIYHASARLTAYLATKYNIPIERTKDIDGTGFIAHSDVYGPCKSDLRTDPGDFWDWDYYLTLVQCYADAGFFTAKDDPRRAAAWAPKAQAKHGHWKLATPTDLKAKKKGYVDAEDAETKLGYKVSSGMKDALWTAPEPAATVAAAGDTGDTADTGEKAVE